MARIVLFTYNDFDNNVCKLIKVHEGWVVSDSVARVIVSPLV